MSLGKLPVIGWVSGSHSKRRLKTELTPDMISPPLRDFRHTMHVGRGGDAFGDTSFLRNHGGKDAKYNNNFFARTLRHVRRSPLRNRGSRGKDETSPTPPEISPIIKNAVSLPQLNEGSYGNDSFGVPFSFKSTPNSFSDYGKWPLGQHLVGRASELYRCFQFLKCAMESMIQISLWHENSVLRMLCIQN